MLIFRNPGVVDLAALTTLGVSVKAEGSFGWFGTGFKFALATVLRGDGEVKVYAGERCFGFEAEEEMIRGQPFRRVWVTDYDTEGSTPLGFTDQLGRGWEPWMALREFACNARDEGGDVEHISDGDLWSKYNADETVIAVTWDKLDEAWAQRGDLFAEAEPLWQAEKLRILPGPADHMYYRGVRARKLEKRSLFRYDVLEHLTLTEDRTIANTWSADGEVRRALLGRVEDEGILGAVVTARDNESYESKLSFDSDEYAHVSRAFIDACADADAAHQPLMKSARAVWNRWKRSTADAPIGRAYHSNVHDDFSDAVAALEELGFTQVADMQVFLADELPGEALSALEKGRVYILRKLLLAGPRVIAQEMLTRILERDHYSLESALGEVIPLLLDQHGITRVHHREQLGEDPAPEPEEMTPEQATEIEASLEVLDPTGEEQAAHEAEVAQTQKELGIYVDEDPGVPF